MELLKEPELWVAAGLVVFLAILMIAKVPAFAAKNLDDRSARIKADLDEAKRLREEAQALLDSLKVRRAEMEADAAKMLADARAEAIQLEADAKVKLEAQIARRTELADRRIALAETQAAAEVKAAAGEMAANAAEALLRARIAGATSDPLIDRAVGELAQRLQ